MPSRKKTPAAELVEKLLAVLEAQRALGKEAYPLTLQRLAELADPRAAAELIGKAVGAKAFKDGAVVASKKDSSGLVALTADKEQLASDPRLLEWALAPLCTPENPLWPLAKVKNRIENTELRKSFEQAVRRQVLENRLPRTAGYRLEKDKPLLFLTSNPPRNRDEVLAEKLLRVLEAQRQLGGDSYPLPLGRLVELTQPGTKAQLVNKALAQPTIQGKLLLIDAKKPEAPVAFVQDRDQLLSSRRLLEYLLRAKHKPNQNAFAIDSLLPKKSDLFQPVLDAINLKIEANSLPPTLGWMWIGKKRQIFFLEDIRHSRLAEAPVAAPSPTSPPSSGPSEVPADFALAFDEAFNQFNRRNGGHNFVSLVDMRRALPLPADGFDAELRKLRVAGRYTLSAAEGRHGVSPEEHKAGIVEDGSLLLYVSRKAP